MIDFIILGIILILCALCIWKLVSDRRKGIGSCGGMCSGCASHGNCSTKDVPERFKAKK